MTLSVYGTTGEYRQVACSMIARLATRSQAQLRSLDESNPAIGDAYNAIEYYPRCWDLFWSDQTPLCTSGIRVTLIGIFRVRHLFSQVHRWVIGIFPSPAEQHLFSQVHRSAQHLELLMLQVQLQFRSPQSYSSAGTNPIR